MLQVSAGSRIFLAVHPVDFRKGIDGLARMVKEVFSTHPMSGSFFLFCNKRRNSFKILFYDGQGYWLCMKRLSSGKFRYWPKGNNESLKLTVSELQILLWNGDPALAGHMWKKIDTDVEKAAPGEDEKE